MFLLLLQYRKTTLSASIVLGIFMLFITCFIPGKPTMVLGRMASDWLGPGSEMGARGLSFILNVPFIICSIREFFNKDPMSFNNIWMALAVFSTLQFLAMIVGLVIY